MPTLSFVLFALSSLFAVIDPLGCIPFFSGLTARMTDRQKRRTLARSLTIAFCVLMAFTWGGTALLKLFGITINAFRIAGGVIFFGIGLDMLRSEPRRWRTGINRAYAEDLGARDEDDPDGDDPSITPLAIPLLAGPGSITTVMVLRADGGASPLGGALVSAAVLAILVLTAVIVHFADRVLRRLGASGMKVVEKLMGLVLTVIAIQLIIDGVVPVVRNMLGIEG
jgi:multiple antibiotic resistance protein